MLSQAGLVASRDDNSERDWHYGDSLLAAAESGDELMVRTLLEGIADADV